MGGKENSKITDLCEFKASTVYTEFQNIQGYIVRVCLKSKQANNKTKQRNRRKNGNNANVN